METLPRKSRPVGKPLASMTFWSRYDPVVIPVDNTDHWAKLRVRSSTGNLNGRRYTSQVPIGVVDKRRDPVKEEFQARMKQLQEHGDGRVDPKGVAVFSQVVAQDLHGNIPGNYTLARPRTTPNRVTLRSSYNERAKENFKFWYQERPKPTSYGRYGIGSYKTVLGLGNAPRT